MAGATAGQNYNFSDLLNFGKPKPTFSFGVSDEMAYNYNPDRYGFYMQFANALNDPNPSLMSTVMSILSNSRLTLDQYHDRMREIMKSIKTVMAPAYDPGRMAKLNAQLKANPMTANMALAYQPGNAPVQPALNTPAATGFSPPTPVQQAAADTRLRDNTINDDLRARGLIGGAGDENGTYFSNLEKSINYAETAKGPVGKIIKEYEENPVFGTEVDKITPTDRAVFIAMTYIIRGTVLFILNWAINSNMVATFENAFILYFTTYIAVFLIIVLLVNTENNLFFRLLFYYIDGRNNGYGRIALHIFVQLFLMPVIWILKDNSNTMKIDNYSSGRNIYKIISDYTFFIWLFSSLLVLRY